MDCRNSFSLEAFLACRFIPLEKNSGLIPVGVGEVFQRNADKVIAVYVRDDIITPEGFLQFCTGFEA